MTIICGHYRVRLRQRGLTVEVVQPESWLQCIRPEPRNEMLKQKVEPFIGRSCGKTVANPRITTHPAVTEIHHNSGCPMSGFSDVGIVRLARPLLPMHGASNFPQAAVSFPPASRNVTFLNSGVPKIYWSVPGHTE